jgi:hypothetical protein
MGESEATRKIWGSDNQSWAKRNDGYPSYPCIWCTQIYIGLRERILDWDLIDNITRSSTKLLLYYGPYRTVILMKYISIRPMRNLKSAGC